MNSIKILIIGNKNTGKTALIEKIVDNKFTITKHIPTFGVSFFQKKINEKKIEFWDCSGSEEYIYFINMLFCDASYIFLCFDVSELSSYQSIKTFWLPFLKENKVDSKIIIIGNKNDLNNDFIIDYTTLINEYELSLNIYPKIFLLSAKKNNNFEEIMNIIINLN